EIRSRPAPAMGWAESTSRSFAPAAWANRHKFSARIHCVPLRLCVKIAPIMNRLLAATVLLSTLTISAAQKADDIPLAEAKECRERGGLPNFLAKLQRGAE